MTSQIAAGDPDEDNPEYRVSHLMDDIADAFADRDMVQKVAPLNRGGIKPRVQNRVVFTTSSENGEPGGAREDVEQVLDIRQFAWTLGETPGEYVVLGREVHDLRELRRGDRIHVNTRRGPFKVYRVMEHPPEVLQRSDPAVTVELTNVDTDTDWMLVHWKNETLPWAYVRTYDKHAKGDYRYRKVEKAERLGRVGPFRLYAPSHDHVSEGYQDRLLEMVDGADGADIHPMDVERVQALMARPAAEVYAPEDADTIRQVMEAVSEYHEREADALTIESDEDRDKAGRHQGLAKEAEQFAKAFNLANMDAVADTDDTSIYRCEDCGKAYTDRFKYPTHRREAHPDDGGESGNGDE